MGYAKLAEMLIGPFMGRRFDGKSEGAMHNLSKKELLRNAVAANKQEDFAESLGENVVDMEGLEQAFEEMGALFRGGRGGSQSKASGKGRHAGTRRFRKNKGGKQESLTSEELRQEAGIVKAAQRYDDGDIFQAWSGNKEFWVRTGTEVFMGMDDAVTSITAGTIGTFEAAPNKEFELQGIRIQHNGDGTTAANTIAIHQTLLAHLAFSYINVGDDKMITGANYVGADTLQDRQTQNGDLAGFIVTPTQKLSSGVLNAAAYAAPVFITAVGELVVLYGK